MLSGGWGFSTVAQESSSYGGKKHGSKKGLSYEARSIWWVLASVCRRALYEIGEFIHFGFVCWGY